MLITSFRIRKIEAPTNRLIAKCTLTFDNMFAVSDIKILVKEDGAYYMGMPSRKTSAGTYKDEAYPINAETRYALEKVLFAAIDYCAENDTMAISGDNKSDKASLLEQDLNDFAISNL